MRSHVTLVSASALIALAGCTGTDIGAPDPFGPPALDLLPAPPAAFCGVVTVVDLIADGGVVVGSVEVVNDESAVYVTYRTDPAVSIRRTAIVAVDRLSEIPTTPSGNPQPGRFPYKSNHGDLPNSVTWQLDVAFAEGGVLHIAAFAEVLLAGEEEGAWGAGDPITPNGSWATRFMHTVQSCDGTISKEITSSGGTIEGPGLTLTVEPDALSETVILSITPTTSDNPFAIDGSIFEFEPDGTTFEPPASLTLAYDPTKLPAGFPEANLKGFIANGTFVLVEPTSIDEVNNLITFPVEHFTTGGTAAPTVDLAVASVGVNPNPMRIGGGDVAIDVVLENADAVATTDVDLLLEFSGAFFIIQDADMPAGCVRTGPDANGVMLVRCDAGTLAPGESAAWQIIGQPFSNDAFKTLTIVAEALPDETSLHTDIVPGNNVISENVDILPATAADLQMWGFGTGPAVKKAGQPVEVFTTMRSIDTGLDAVDATLEVDILGGGTASTAIPQEGLPADCARTITDNTASIVCDLGTVIPGGEVSRTTSFIPLRTGDFTVVATVVVSGGSDPNTGNNSQQQFFTVEAPIIDLEAHLVDNLDPVDIGQLFVYTARGMNGATSEDPLPAGSVLRIEVDGDAEFFGSPTAGCTDVTATVGFNAVSCVLDEDLVPGSSTNGYSVTVRPLSGPQTLTGRAFFLVPDYIDDHDPNPANNEAVEETSVNADNLVDFEVFHLTATEVGDGAAAPIQPFDVVRFQARVDLKLASSPPIDGGTVEFSIAGDFTVQTTPAGCSSLPFPVGSGYTIECPIGSYGEGEIKTFDVDVVPDRIQTLDATATVAGPAGTEETDPSNQSKAASADVEPFSADLAMSLVLDDVDPVVAGEIVTYTFDATNNGPDDTNVASVYLLLDGDVEIVSTPPDADIACSPPSTSSGLADVAILCTVAPLEVTNARRFNFEVRPLSGTEVVATAQIFAAPLTTVDPNAGNGENSQTTTVEPAAPTLSGDLMYTTNLNGTQGRIFIQSLPSGVPSMVGVISFAVDPVWSPDRSKIAYVRGSLRVVDADGSNDTELVDLIPFQLIGAPEWLDDDRIVFHMSDERDLPVPDLDLYVYTLSTQTLTQLTDNDVDDRDPDASSGQIAYVRGDGEIRTMSYDGSGDATLFTDSDVVRHPQWSDDLSQIAFARDNDSGDDELVILDVGPLTTTPIHSSSLIDKPIWSPDGQFIAFVTDNGFEIAIYYIAFDGSGGAAPLRADPDFSFTDPDWR